MKSVNNIPTLSRTILFILLTNMVSSCSTMHLKKGSKYYEKGDYLKAFIEYDRARKKGVRFDDESLYRLAASLFEIKRFGECIVITREGLKRGKDEVRWRLLYAEALYVSGKLHTSIEEYEKVIALAPSDYLSRVRLGVLLVQAGLLDQGIGRFIEAVSISPDEPLAYRYLYELYKTRLKNERTAYFFLKRSIEKSKKECSDTADLREEMEKMEHTNLALKEFYIKRGLIFDAEIFSRRQEWKEAEDRYRRYIELEPDDPYALFGLGRALSMQGRDRESLEYVRRAYSLDMGNEEFFETLAELYRDLGKCPDLRQEYGNDEVTKKLVEKYCPSVVDKRPGGNGNGK